MIYPSEYSQSVASGPQKQISIDNPFGNSELSATVIVRFFFVSPFLNQSEVTSPTPETTPTILTIQLSLY